MKGSVISLRVCLVGCIFGRMEKKKRVENRKENEWEGVWLKGEGERKVVGPTSFLSPPPPLQNTISPNWRENWSEK